MGKEGVNVRPVAYALELDHVRVRCDRESGYLPISDTYIGSFILVCSRQMLPYFWLQVPASPATTVFQKYSCPNFLD